VRNLDDNDLVEGKAQAGASGSVRPVTKEASKRERRVKEMGEITEMVLDGILCESCGVYIDDGEIPGHPRRCKGCEVEEE
jgi:hypothetical protein